uniref:Uncharacterized protein n=1 Tax=Anser brachyrhynchus TaxID=132585 RepID=A0A8B9C579_9AVES
MKSNIFDQTMGHFATECPQQGAGGEHGNPAPPTICPRCGKGWHWASQSENGNYFTIYIK